MANLLSVPVQKTIFMRAIARILIAVALLFAGLGLVGIFALMPAYLTLQTRQAAIAYELTALNGSQAAQQQDDRDAIITANRQLAVAGGMAAPGHDPARAIRTVIESRPAGMTLARLDYAAGKAGSSTEATLSISGITAHAADQTAYLSALRAIPGFASVEIPISALAHADTNAVTYEVRGTF
ncbi:MAG TPA: hypothetical protein VFL98_03750 [Candidatus Paceibacterota bacterium]|nr:hypothetical protein [Candidatus Paceibacterota bacterium]